MSEQVLKTIFSYYLIILSLMCIASVLSSSDPNLRGRGFESEEIEPNVGLPQQIDLEDLPVTGLAPEQALDLLFQRYRARMLELHEPRMSTMEDLSEKEIGEICGSSASLECGKKVLKYSDYSEDSAPVISIHLRCSLRKEFLECIDAQRKNCRRQAAKGIYPRMPPKSLIRVSQSKIWRSLWTSGGCTLAN